MLRDVDVIATIAVKDIAKARRFYADEPGFEAHSDGEPGTLTLVTGNTSLLVYESKYAGTNQATSATWEVDDNVEDYVKELSKKGVTFEHYDFPEGHIKSKCALHGRHEGRMVQGP